MEIEKTLNRLLKNIQRNTPPEAKLLPLGHQSMPETEVIDMMLARNNKLDPMQVIRTEAYLYAAQMIETMYPMLLGSGMISHEQVENASRASQTHLGCLRVARQLFIQVGDATNDINQDGYEPDGPTLGDMLGGEDGTRAVMQEAAEKLQEIGEIDSADRIVNTFVGNPRPKPNPEAFRMFEMIDRGDYKQAQNCIVQKPSLLEAQDTDGRTPLYRAAMDNRIEFIYFCRAHGANMNTKSRDHWTPVFEATIKVQICNQTTLSKKFPTYEPGARFQFVVR